MARYTLIPEKGYATVMNQMIVPGLKPFHESGTLEVSPGHPIRWDYYSCPDARGSIIISHGFIESGFKFIEMVYYFRQMGLNVCTVDHRGHGHSYRAVKDPSTTDADRFYDYVDDLHGIITEILMKKGNGPYLLYAHSMGGAIGACYLKQHPGVISGAIFNAPMIRAQTGGLPLGVANAIAKTAIRFGQGEKMVFVHKIYDPEESFEQSAATSRARFDWYSGVRRNNVCYRNNGASYKWLRETVGVCRELTGKEGAKGIDIPCVFYIAHKDTFVVSSEIRAFAAKIPHARTITIPASKHEIYRSGNEALTIYLNSIEDFIDQIAPMEPASVPEGKKD